MACLYAKKSRLAIWWIQWAIYLGARLGVLAGEHRDKEGPSTSAPQHHVQTASQNRNVPRTRVMHVV
jgi:hypothetical protein